MPDGNAIYPDWPSASVRILDGANASKRRAQLAEPAEFYIINWEKLRSDAQMLADAHTWRAIIADEAHRAKNRKAQQTKGLWKLAAPIVIAASGTPVMNTPDELWPLLRWVRPEQYGADNTGTKTTFWQFHYTYVDDYPTKFGRVMRGVKNADDLRFELGDKMVRRTKVEVLPDLPEKLPPTVIEVELNASERRLYREAEEALFLDAANFALRKATEEHEEGTAKAIIDARAEEIAEELAAQPLERLQGLIENGAARMTALRQITARAKAREAVELIRDNPTKPFVTFTWYVEPAQWIAEQLRADKLRVGLAAGAGGPDASEEAKLFQAEEYDQFVGTISKGGTGLDLYRSDTVIMADLDWVPDINDQAVDRLHRQGQTNDVSTIILQVPDTVDTGSVAEANAFKTAIKRELFGRA
jgi:SNF2 family DNA or RNA helicase